MQEIEQLISDRNACRKRGEYSKAQGLPLALSASRNIKIKSTVQKKDCCQQLPTQRMEMNVRNVCMKWSRCL